MENTIYFPLFPRTFNELHINARWELVSNVHWKVATERRIWKSGLPDHILLAFSCIFLDWSCLDLENIPLHPHSKWLTVLSLKEDEIIPKTSFPSRTWKGCRGIDGWRGWGWGNDSRQGVFVKRKKETEMRGTSMWTEPHPFVSTVPAVEWWSSRYQEKGILVAQGWILESLVLDSWRAMSLKTQTQPEI